MLFGFSGVRMLSSHSNQCESCFPHRNSIPVSISLSRLSLSLSLSLSPALTRRTTLKTTVIRSAQWPFAARSHTHTNTRTHARARAHTHTRARTHAHTHTHTPNNNNKWQILKIIYFIRSQTLKYHKAIKLRATVLTFTVDSGYNASPAPKVV